MVIHYERYQALIISLVVHALLLFVFVHYSFVNEQTKRIREPIEKETIKSYLYVAPKKPQTNIELIEIPTITEPIQEKPLKPNIEQVAKYISTPNKAIPVEEKVIENTDNNTKESPPRLSYQQLNALRENINQKIIDEEIALSLQIKSPSVMHGEQVPVPHSEKQFTQQQIKEANTTNYSDSLSIIKGKNGFCTVERDLTSIGMDGIKSVQGFACGESAFDKSFREHMTKVKQKLGK